MHRKEWIFDSEFIYTGSCNLTKNGMRNNVERLTVISDSACVAQAEAEFEEHWATAEEVTDEDMAAMMATFARRRPAQSKLAKHHSAPCLDSPPRGSCPAVDSLTEDLQALTLKDSRAGSLTSTKPTKSTRKVPSQKPSPQPQTRELAHQLQATLFMTPLPARLLTDEGNEFLDADSRTPTSAASDAT
jgi:hypothetical protein